MQTLKYFQTLLKNRPKYELVLALFITKVYYGELKPENIERILSGDFEAIPELYEDLVTFLKKNPTSALYKDFNNSLGNVMYIDRSRIKEVRNIIIQPNDPCQIALKTTHDEIVVNQKMIREAVEKQGYVAEGFPVSSCLNILYFLKMGKWSDERDQFTAYPEKMEILWPFLADENYKIPKKVTNL